MTQQQRVLVYSDDRNVRAAIVAALGRRPAADLPLVATHECATHAAVMTAVTAGGFDLAILDGEAAPAGGLGICRQIKEEIYNAPPVIVVIGRAQDAWLAAWSKAEMVLAHPVDPFAMADAAAALLRQRVATA